MTREQKLALILGFALTLVVGVLISDHLSGARSTATPQLTDALKPRNLPRPGLGRETAGYMLVERVPPAAPDIYASNAPRETLVTETTPSSDPIDLGWDRSRIAQAVDDLVNGNADLPAAANVETIVMAPRERRQPTTVEVPARDPLRDDAVTTSTTQPAPSQQRELVHRVREGDTLWSIAQQYYGDGSQWTRLRERNQGRIMSDGQVRKGATIVIPGVPATAQRITPEPRTVVAKAKTYTVQRGDTLGEISMKTLGTSRRWQEIVDLNKDRIRDPQNIPVGVELRLPST